MGCEYCKQPILKGQMIERISEGRSARTKAMKFHEGHLMHYVEAMVNLARFDFLEGLDG